MEVHVTFSNAGKSLYGGTVKPLAMSKAVGELLNGNGHALGHAHDIGKFQVDKAYLRGFNGRQNGIFCGLFLLLCHNSFPRFVNLRVRPIIAPLLI